MNLDNSKGTIYLKIFAKIFLKINAMYRFKALNVKKKEKNACLFYSRYPHDSSI